jgi:hypothetical protein
MLIIQMWGALTRDRISSQRTVSISTLNGTDERIVDGTHAELGKSRVHISVTLPSNLIEVIFFIHFLSWQVQSGPK